MGLFSFLGGEGGEGNEGNEHGGAANSSGTLVQAPTTGTPTTTAQTPATTAQTPTTTAQTPATSPTIGVTLRGGEGDHQLQGGNGDDTLVGGGGNLVLAGGGGTNTFNVQAGQDTLADAKPGQDHINIASGATAVQNLTTTTADYSANTANSGTLVVNAPQTGAATTIIGAPSGHNELHGGAGDDTLVVPGGNGTLYGGGGTNTFKVEAGEATLADAKPGQDHIEIAHGAIAVQNLTSSTANYSANTTNNGTLVINAPQTTAATITGSSGNDEIHLGRGNDTFDGGAGINTAVFATSSTNVNIAPSGNGLIVHDASGATGTDTLTNVQRLHFSDTNIAMDIDGHAGITAKILGAVFGAASVSNAAYAGIGLNYLDGGMSYESLMQLALNAAGATTHKAEVDLLWSNLFGSAPTAAQAAPYIDMLDSGTTTPGALGVLAANTGTNTSNINLTGLQQTGIQYTAPGTAVTPATGTAATPATGTTGTTATPATGTAVAVAAAGTFDANVPAGNYAFNVAAGNYACTVNNFAVGDSVVMPTGAQATVSNPSFTDGTVDLQWASAGQLVTVTLTGLSPAQDAAAAFGAGSNTFTVA